MRIAILMAWLLAGCGGLFGSGSEETSETVAEPEPEPEAQWGAAGTGTTVALPEGAAVDPVVWNIVAGNPRYANVSVVPLAQLARGSKVVVLAWPMLSAEGTILDDDVVGSTLELGADASWREVHGNWGVRGAAGRARIAEELGGTDWTVRDRREGVPFSELGPRFVDATRRFHDAVAARDRTAAVQTAVEISRMVPLDVAALDDRMTEMLTKVAGEATLELVSVDPPNARIVIRIRDGARTGEIAFPAIHVTPEADRWILGNPVAPPAPVAPPTPP